MPALTTGKLMGFAATTNVEAAKAFYSGKLGLKLVSEEHFALVYDANGTMLRVQRVKEVVAPPYTSLGWEVVDIAATAKALRDAGVQLERFPGMEQDELGIWTPPGSTTRVGWFKDPEGCILSITQF